MSDEIYLRRYRLKLGRDTSARIYEMQPDGDGLRITFQVIHFAGNAFSVAEITIYNVSDYATRQMLGDGSVKKYEFISLEAGYASTFGTVFLGQITNVQKVLEDGGSTRGVKFFCRAQAKERDQRIINLTLSPETDPVQIIEECAERFGGEIQFFGDFSNLRRRSGGSVLQGNPVACMNELAATYEFDWMNESGATKIIKKGFAMANEVFVINAATGMIGSPVVTDTEVGIRFALNPKLKLGDTIKLEAMAPRFEFSDVFFYKVPRTIGEGLYRIYSLAIIGDSHGDPWETQISCLRLDTMSQSGISERAGR
ncbi:baseplate hub protein [Pseudomonas sp. NY11955]|uniref:baseplate hub protein n=1 Tax=Pseudomonas sp. NY11955 TaxID=3400363 RepID=UPI003A871F5B